MTTSPVEWDVAVLGSGPGGYAAALRASQRGARVVLVEAGHVGGTCLNSGCIPSKAMLHASEVCWESRCAGELGLAGAALTPDGPQFMSRIVKTVALLRKGVESLLAARKVSLVRGRGRLTAPGSLLVQTPDGQTELRARSVILATGSRPVRPSLFPWSDPRVQTTDEATTAAELPANVLIVGGGIIGCEMACAHAELGIATTLVELESRILPTLEDDAAQVVARSLRRRGVNVIAGVGVAEASADDDGIACRLADGQQLRAARVIVVVGRRANLEDIGLEQAGVRVADGIVPVDESCRTNVPGVYAIGDLAEKRQYAHLAQRMGQVAADHAAGHVAGDDRSVVPVGLYTHPEVATVGLTQAQARAAGLDVRASVFPFQASGMARAHAQADGSVKLLATADGRLVGATVIGPRATDIIQELALAMRTGQTVRDVARTIHAHPTFVEAIHEAAESWLGLPVHTLR